MHLKNFEIGTNELVYNSKEQKKETHGTHSQPSERQNAHRCGHKSSRQPRRPRIVFFSFFCVEHYCVERLRHTLKEATHALSVLEKICMVSPDSVRGLIHLQEVRKIVISTHITSAKEMTIADI